MNLERVGTIKMYLLIALSALFIVASLVLAKNNPNFHTMKGEVIYLLEILNLLFIFWLFYLISEINLFVQGKIGKTLTFIVLGLIIFSSKSALVVMESLQIPFIREIGSILTQPVILSIFRTITLFLLIIAIANLVKLYKK